jgi:hypothetical protein
MVWMRREMEEELLGRHPLACPPPPTKKKQLHRGKASLTRYLNFGGGILCANHDNI